MVLLNLLGEVYACPNRQRTHPHSKINRPKVYSTGILSMHDNLKTKIIQKLKCSGDIKEMPATSLKSPSGKQQLKVKENTAACD